MKYKSALLSQASGAMAGMVASRNKGGAFLRARVIPTNPSTPYQTKIRGAMGALSNLFKQLTDIQRQSWDDYASNVSLVDRLGDARKVSAINMFQRCNAIRYALLGPEYINTQAPTTYNLGATPTVGTFTATYNAPGLLDINLVVNIADAPATPVLGDDILIFSSQPQNPSVKSFKGPFRFNGLSQIAAPSAQPQTITKVLSGNWKILGGDRVYVRICTSRADGRLSSDVICAAVTGPHV